MFKIAVLFLFTLFSVIAQRDTTFLFQINNLKLAIDYTGIIGDVLIPSYGTGGSYLGNRVLFDGGFLISGIRNGKQWGDGQASSLLTRTFLPGKVKSNPYDPQNVLYILRSSDPVFGPSWQKYRDAVFLGAEFYDGNKDGIYDPVDVNRNGEWDVNEDAPNIVGDVTTWCVFNDGVTVRDRFRNPPMGIEIQQTAFAYNFTGGNGDIIFFRYRIINTGSVDDILRSIRFAVYADADIQLYTSNLVGCDTSLNAAFTYTDTITNPGDGVPAAFLVSFIQGPIVYIPGETYLDNNNNGRFDEYEDSPLDTAYNNLGSLIGLKRYAGAKNASVSSFYNMQSYLPILDLCMDYECIYYYIEGKNELGEYVDPCTDERGIVQGVDCSAVDPRFLFSGDPVLRKGWINTQRTEQRQVLTVGPFDLEKNKPMDIIIAYTAAKGDSPLASVTEAKKKAIFAKGIYDLNFPGIEPNITYNPPPVYNYYLSENYPNPFNSSTTIRYSLKSSSHIKLAIYDVLGREIQILQEGQVSEGIHEIKFNSNNLTSGIYFYKLKAASQDGNNILNQSRKMVILK